MSVGNHNRGSFLSVGFGLFLPFPQFGFDAASPATGGFAFYVRLFGIAFYIRIFCYNFYIRNGSIPAASPNGLRSTEKLKFPYYTCMEEVYL